MTATQSTIETATTFFERSGEESTMTVATQHETSGLKRHFAHPAGFLGRIAGRIMAIKNQPLVRLASRKLSAGKLSGSQRVLDIGFGAGRSVSEIDRWAKFTAGVELSEEMWKQASLRNQKSIAEGRVELHHASVSQLPFPTGSFHQALALNNIQLWPDLVDDLSEVKRVLAPGGRLLVPLRRLDPKRWIPAGPTFDEAFLDKLESAMRRAGFAEVRREEAIADHPVTLLWATKAGK